MVLDVEILTPTQFPSSLCLREEIAAPDKLVHVLMNGDADASGYHSYPCTYPEHPFRRLGFYTQGGVSMFRNFHRMPFNEWFILHWHTYFMITAPVFVDDTSIWTVSCCPPLRIVDLVNSMSHDFRLTSMRLSNCYTICNGLTVAIALHRTGRITSHELLAAVDTLHGLIAPFDDTWLDHYIHRNIPMVADLPEYYAVRGSHVSVLHRFFGMHTPGNMHLLENPVYAIYTNPFSAMFPHLTVANAKFALDIQRWTDDIYGQCRPDFYGLYRGIFTAGCRVWRWWRVAGPDIVEHAYRQYNLRFGRFLMATLPPIFHMYNTYPDRRRQHRMVVCWRDIIRIVGRERVGTWLRHHLTNPSHHPIPLAFLMDVLDSPRGLRTHAHIDAHVAAFISIKDKILLHRLMVVNRLEHPVGRLVLMHMRTHVS